MAKEKRTYAQRKAQNPQWAANMAARVTKSRRNTQKRLKEEAGGCCSICGYDKCIAALEFHHPDPTIKESKIIGTSKSYAVQKAEADKCILVCANCHREIHYTQPKD